MRKFFANLWKGITFPFRTIWRLVGLPFRLFTRFSLFLNETPEEQQLPDAFSKSVQKPALLLEHLNDLRKHIFRILVAMVIFVAVMFAFTPQLVDFLALPIGGLDALTAIDVTESVGVFMRVAFLGAVVLASPYIAFELWLFAAPGLMPRARKFGLMGIPLVLVFFVSGIAFTYLFLLPTALPFLLNFMGIHSLPRVSSYINFVTGIMFWIGISFEFPLVVYIITMMGILQPRTLAKQWRLAVLIIAIAAAAITPTVDPINMSIVMAPLIILYIISIGLSFLAAIGRKNKAQTS
ncbi:MAG: twin-arginine translocase subunit TatC [Anaerolineales bacterium]